MVRRFLLPLLGLAFCLTEAATAQALPVPTPTAAPQKAARRTGRTLTAREVRAAAAAAKAAQAKTVAATTVAVQHTAWSGWSSDAMPASDPTTHRPTMSLSVAPGMPINQVGHGVTTDYNGRTLQHTAANTTLPMQP